MHHSFAGEAGSQTPCMCLHLLCVPMPSHLHILLKAWSFIAMPEATFCPAQPHLSPGSRPVLPTPKQESCGSPCICAAQPRRQHLSINQKALLLISEAHAGHISQDQTLSGSLRCTDYA